MFFDSGKYLKKTLIILVLLVSGFMILPATASAEMSISVDPPSVEFGEVFRDTTDNPKESDDVVTSVVSENIGYFLSVRGTDMEGEAVQTSSIPAENLKYEINGSGNWESVSDVLTPVLHGEATDPGGDNHSFDFLLDIPWDIYLQEYNGTLVFDVTSLEMNFDPDGNDTPAMSHSSVVTVESLNAYNLLYQWAASDDEGALVEEGWTGFTSGDEIFSPEGVTGDYYLWINVAGYLFCSERFLLDNTAPTGTISIDAGAIYAEPFSDLELTLNATDNLSGVSEMRFLNGSPENPEESENWSDWEPYATSRTWQQHVYSGGGGSVANELIIHDIFIPEGDYELNFMEYVSATGDHDNHEIRVGTDDGEGGTDWETHAVLGSRSIDDVNGYFRRVNLSSYEGQEISISFLNEGTNTAAWEVDDIHVMNSIQEGTKTVQVQFRDDSGNISQAYADTIDVHALYWYGVVEDWADGFADYNEQHDGEPPERQIDASDADGVHKFLNASTARECEVAYVTDQAFDLSGIGDIYIEWKNTGRDGPQNISSFNVSTSKEGDYDTDNEAVIQKTRDFALVTESLDVSEINDACYIRVHARNNANALRESIVHSYRIWFE